MAGRQRRRQISARVFQPQPCAVIGCGEQAEPGCIYCRECQNRSSEALGAPGEPGTLEVDTLPLLDRTGAMARRLELYGPHPCALCGQPALPGRQYCSEPCRTRARAGASEWNQVELDGTRATVLKHAVRLGIDKSTVYMRLRRGLTPEQALTRPVDEEMRRRRLNP